MKKRIWLILLVLAMLTGCLSACGASSVPAADQISSAAEEAVPGKEAEEAVSEKEGAEKEEEEGEGSAPGCGGGEDDSFFRT